MMFRPRQRPYQRGSAALWLVAVAALAVLVIAGLLAASSPDRLRSQSSTATTPITTPEEELATVKVITNDPKNCRVTTDKDPEVKIDEEGHGIDCGEKCAEKYPEGSEFTLYVHPIEGYEFDKWVDKLGKNRSKNCQACTGKTDRSKSECGPLAVPPSGNTCIATCKKKASNPTPSP